MILLWKYLKYFNYGDDRPARISRHIAKKRIDASLRVDSRFIGLCVPRASWESEREIYLSCPPENLSLSPRTKARSPRRSFTLPRSPGVCLISELPFRPLCSTPREHDQSSNGLGRPRSFVCRSDRPRPPSRRIYLSYPISH